MVAPPEATVVLAARAEILATGLTVVEVVQRLLQVRRQGTVCLFHQTPTRASVMCLLLRRVQPPTAARRRGRGGPPASGGQRHGSELPTLRMTRMRVV